MAYDSDPASTHNPATGGTPTAAWGDIINANFAAIGAAWTSFTPAWTGTGSNPAIGNGTRTGAYRQLGKTLDLSIDITMGSTTTYGTGDWLLELPNSLSAVASRWQTLSAVAFDNSAGTYYVGMAITNTSAATTLYVVRDGASPSAFTSAVPFTWAQNDRLAITGVLEVA